ncbi:hypothetical protein Bpfe_003636 [Biomphalaria pfeifferi]|uniref:Uncharacterized protein n=1 Tax=Biomphalaria pfeifferi TaxID=112525 RepID=A0AAD8C5T6_BIOPF|nr:hypothetical protein Bpfe_003636 [Biomphalaria pfeifferi]
MVVNKKLILAEQISSFQRDLSTPESVEFKHLESQLNVLKINIQDNGLEKEYFLLINWFDTKLKDVKKEMLHREEIMKLNEARKDLEHRVLGIQIPVLKSLIFDELRQEAAVLEERANRHSNNCYCINNLRQAVKDLKEKIENLSKDNNIYLGWTGATTVLGVASIGVAFIPVVGLPIAAVMNSAPYLGKLAHRLTVSYNRKKTFKN